VSSFFHKAEERLFGRHEQPHEQGADDQAADAAGPIADEPSMVIAEEALDQALDAGEGAPQDARRFGSKDPFD
jgi:hypothetical protein